MEEEQADVIVMWCKLVTVLLTELPPPCTIGFPMLWVLCGGIMF